MYQTVVLQSVLIRINGVRTDLDSVVNSYFDTFFPGAVALAKRLRAAGGVERLRWMLGSRIWGEKRFSAPGKERARFFL